MKGVEKVGAHIADAVKKGARVVAGGKRSALASSFVEPTVLTDVTTDMVITKEETFGPVAPLYRLKTEKEAIKMASETPTASGECWRGGRRHFLQPRHRPHLARRRGARIRYRRHQRRHHFDRIRPFDAISYGLELRSGLSASRSTGTETCSWTMNHRPRVF
jgi:Aldehyde dehydrogenase family